MIPEIVGKASLGLQFFQHLGVGDVPRHDQRAGQRQPSGNRMLAQRRKDVGHRPAQVDGHRRHLVRLVGLRKEAGRVTLKPLNKNALGCDLRQCLPVGRAGHANADGAGRAMARQADHPYIMAVILPAELSADAKLAGDLQDFGFPGGVAPGMAKAVAFGWQAVQRADRGLLHCLQIIFSRGAADDDGKVVGRAGRGAKVEDRRFDEIAKPVRVQHRLCLLVKEGLVGRPAALLDEGEFILGALAGIEVDLRRKVGAGVDLFEHAGGGKLRIAQIALQIGIKDPARQCLAVIACDQNPVAAGARDDRGAGVLAHWQQPFGGHHGVLQHFQRHESVILRGLGIVEDGAKLGKVAAAKKVRNIGEGPLRQQPQGVWIDFQERLAVKLDHFDMVGADKVVNGAVFRLREHRAVGEIGHFGLSAGQGGRVQDGDLRKLSSETTSAESAGAPDG